MPYVVAGLAVVSAVAALNLLLTFGVIRRLRQHTVFLAASASGPPMPKPMDPVGPFSTRSVDGEPVSNESLDGGSLVVFLSPGCSPCEEMLVPLVRHLRLQNRDDRETLIVLVADSKTSTSMFDDLRQLSAVVREVPGGEIQQAFRVSVLPTMVTADAGVIAAVHDNVADLAVAGG